MCIVVLDCQAYMGNNSLGSSLLTYMSPFKFVYVFLLTDSARAAVYRGGSCFVHILSVNINLASDVQVCTYKQVDGFARGCITEL